jgi:tetratricopeptide (TPR) repeat protein
VLVPGKKTYWLQLSAVNSLPYRGARVLEDAIGRQTVSLVDAAVYEKLANCWIAAREFERAVAPLQRAAELSGSGEPLVRLAEIYVERDDWPAAEVALRSALAKGGLRDIAHVDVLLTAVNAQRQRADL